MKFSAAIAAVAVISTALAHPGPHAEASKSEILRRGALSNKCAKKAASFNEKRWKRNLSRRSLAARSSRNSTVQITTEAPYYEVMQNDTCVLAPEVTEGPYVWPRSQTLRQDMSEGEAGVPLWLDVGVLDMATCEPLEGVLVDFWHCNATGSYSSFTGLSPNTPFETLLDQLNVSDFTIGETDLHTDDTTFLRGMWPTDANGMLEMKTIFPGFYVQRAIHIHVQVHTDWSVRANGTIVAGNTVSTGQLYFDEPLEQRIMALEPYVSHTEINRTTNAEDSIYPEDLVGGYNPVVAVVPADGADVTKGMVGYVTIGVDTTAVESDL